MTGAPSEDLRLDFVDRVPAAGHDEAADLTETLSPDHLGGTGSVVHRLLDRLPALRTVFQVNSRGNAKMWVGCEPLREGFEVIRRQVEVTIQLDDKVELIGLHKVIADIESTDYSCSGL